MSDGSGGSDPAVTGSIDRGGQAESRTEETVTEDGSRVLSIRIRANAGADWDERHTVTAPDGTRTVFETSGLTKTIRDGDTDEILARSTLTKNGAEPEAVLQPAKGPVQFPSLGEVKQRIDAILRAGAALYGAFSERSGEGRKPVFAAPASEYTRGDAFDARAIWVGTVEQDELDRICPRNQEVQAIADTTAAAVRASGNYMTPQDFGNKVHLSIRACLTMRGADSL